MELTSVFQQIAIALGLGMLVGLQREYAAAAHLAGLRTFPLITILGTLSGILAKTFSGWVIAAGFISLAILIVVGNLVALKNESHVVGLTSEVAILLMYGVGIYLTIGPPEVAIAVGGLTAVLLQFKGQLKGLVAKLGDNDLVAIMQFVLIALVILPILPNQTYGPYLVFNPYKMWLLVSLIVGINLGGYILYKIFGEKVGVIFGGVLGGIISSTATTVSYSKQAASNKDLNKSAAFVIVIASTIVFIRVLVEIFLVSPSFLTVAIKPISILLATFIILSAFLWFSGQKPSGKMPEQNNPAQLKSALLFSILYVVVLLAIAAGKDLFGNKGLYLIAAISGLTDVDAITLSTAQLVQKNEIAASNGWRAIVIALMANLVFKLGIVGVLANKELLLKVLSVFSVGFIVAILLLIFA